jgi:hypothetical protein
VHFEQFSFGSIQIDGTVYEYDLVIDPATFESARRRHPGGIETDSATRRSRSKKRFHGAAAGWLSVREQRVGYR